MFVSFLVNILGLYILMNVGLPSYPPLSYGFRIIIFFYYNILFFRILILFLLVVCFLRCWCLFDVLFCMWGMSIFVFLLLNWYIGVRSCCIFGWMGKIGQFVWIFFCTIWICIWLVVLVCIGWFFVVLVPIFCFETFLLDLDFPLLWCHSFVLVFLLILWYLSFILLFLLFSHLWYVFSVFL